MYRLNLYPSATVPGTRPINTQCTLCDAHRTPYKRCITYEPVKPGRTVMVVLEAPTLLEAQTAIPGMSASNKNIIQVIKNLLPPEVSVVVCYAVKCSTSEPVASAATCAPYLHHELAAVKPERVLAFGTASHVALLGRAPVALSVMDGAYDFVGDVPIFILPAPHVTQHNNILIGRLTASIKYATLRDIHALRFPPNPRSSTYSIVTNAFEAAEVASWVASSAVVFDVETTGLQFQDDFRILCLSVAKLNEPDHIAVWSDIALDDPACAAILRDILQRAPEVYGHNISYDVMSVRLDPRLQCTINGVLCDTLVMRALIDNEALGRLSIAAELVGCGGHKGELEKVMEVIKHEVTRRVSAYGKPRRGRGGKPFIYVPPLDDITCHVLKTGIANYKAYAFQFVPADILYRYNAMDALTTTRLAHYFRKYTREMQVYRTLYASTVWALIELMMTGIHVDASAVNTLSTFLQTKIDQLGQRLQQFAAINWDSPQQVSVYFYKTLGLVSRYSPSTDAKALASLSGMHVSVDLLSEYRRYRKLRSTYCDVFHLTDDTQRIHTIYNPIGTDTGRVSSSNPSLQNIPRPTSTEGGMIRNLIVSGSDEAYELIEGDYSQLELRVAAYLSKDPLMIEMFRSGKDFHLETARMICSVAWGMSADAWDALDDTEKKKKRTAAKTVNFGLHYGKGENTLAEEIGCSPEIARQLVDAILNQFHVLRDVMKNVERDGFRDGGIHVMFRGQPANFRRLTDLGLKPDSAKASAIIGHARRGIWNTMVQGTGAQMTNAAMEPIIREFREQHLDAVLCLTNHDALVARAHRSLRSQVIEIMRKHMTNYDLGNVPLIVDFKVGTRWGSMVDTQ